LGVGIVVVDDGGARGEERRGEENWAATLVFLALFQLI
jgi:hypothetical protein